MSGQGLFGRKSNQASLWFRLVVVPTIIAIAADLAAGLYIESRHLPLSPEAFEPILQRGPVLTALIAWIVTNVLMVRIFYGDEHEALTLLKRLIAEVPKPLAQYAKTRMGDSIGHIDSQVRSLEYQGLAGQSFNRKMEIISSLIEHSGKELTRYWATTLDSPSEMFERYDRFFVLQKEQLRQVPDKRRIVVLSSADLNREIDQRHDQLLAFIRWHEQNGFKLLFLVDDTKQFQTEAVQYLEESGLGTAETPLVDFAILGERWVYGEAPPVGVQPLNRDSRLLRLFDRDRRASIVEGHVSFYKTLWGHWRVGRWPILIPEQVVSECTRRSFRLLPVSGPVVQGIQPGAPFFADMLSKIRQAKQSVIAVDIAPLKESGLSEWINSSDYQQWLEATIAANRNGAKVARLHILYEADADRAVRQLVHDNVLKCQIAAGGKVYLASAKALWDQRQAMHDFILIDDNICFSLGWNEHFCAATLSPDRNLDPSVAFKWYKTVFDNLIGLPIVKDASAMNDLQRLTFLEKLA